MFASRVEPGWMVLACDRALRGDHNHVFTAIWGFRLSGHDAGAVVVECIKRSH